MAGGIASLLPSLPRTVRLNNPGGLIQSPVQWAGMAQEQPDSRFVAFETPEAGLQAMAKNIRSYRNRHGLNTVEDIISRWAPPNENNTPAYIARVAQSLGVSPTEPLNLDDPNVMAGLMRAIARHEAGTDHYSAEMIRAALGGTPAPRPGPIPEAAPGETPDYTHRDKTVRELQEFQRSASPMLPPRPGAGIASLAQPTAQPAAPPRAGIASLLQPNSPYMQLANQIAPARQADPWSTLGQIGAAMAASRSPTFLGGLAEGMGHGSQYVDKIGRENDALDRSRYEIAMKMAQLDQPDKPVALPKGAKLVDPRTGRTVAEGNRDEGEFATMLRDAGIDPQSAEGLQLTRAYAQRKGSPTNVSTVVQSGEKAYDTTIGKALAEQRVAIASQAESAPRVIAQADQLGALLEQAGSGALTPALTNLTALGRSLGINVDDLVGVNTPAAEAARTLAREISMKFISETKGSISNAEMQIFLSMVANIGNTPETNTILINTMRAAALRSMKLEQAAQEYEAANNGRLDFGFNKVRERIFADNPLPLSAAKSQRAPKPDAASPPPATTTTAPAAPVAAPATPAPITAPSPTLPPKFDPNTAPRITNDAAGKAAYDALPPGSFFQVPDVRGGWTTRWKAQ